MCKPVLLSASGGALGVAVGIDSTPTATLNQDKALLVPDRI